MAGMYFNSDGDTMDEPVAAERRNHAADQRPEYEFFIGIDIGGTKTAVSLGNGRGELLGKHRFPTKPHYRDVLEDICDAASGILSNLADGEIFPSGYEIPKALRVVKAVGISCGGPLDSVKGVVQSPPNLPSWEDVPIVEILQDRLGIPCYLENDANACALAEWYWGNGRGYRNMIFLTFGTGLGAGLILDSRLYSGACGLAGEVGHLRLADSGPLCYGKHGSWESFCSGSGLSKLYQQVYGTSLTAKEICDLADAGDSDALHVIEMSSRFLGRGLALLIDILNPQCIIIGSIFSRSEELFRRAMEEEIEKEALSLSYRDCVIRPAGLGERLGDMAALGVAINRFGRIGEEDDEYRSG